MIFVRRLQKGPLSRGLFLSLENEGDSDYDVSIMRHWLRTLNLKSIFSRVTASHPPKSPLTRFILVVSVVMNLSSCNSGPGDAYVAVPVPGDTSIISNFRMGVSIDLDAWILALDDSDRFASYDSGHSGDRTSFINLVSEIKDCSKPVTELAVYAYALEADLYAVVQLTDSTHLRVVLVDMAASPQYSVLGTAAIGDSSLTTATTTVVSRDAQNLVITRTATSETLHFVLSTRVTASQKGLICQLLI